MINLAALMLLFISPQSHANVWVRPHQVPLYKLKAHAQALGDQTFSEYQLDQIRKKAREFQIKTQIQQAQELYLSGNLDKAKPAFKKN